MKNIRYKIWSWGGRTGEGSNLQFNVAVCTKAKRSLTNPHELANELLCLRLAHALKLPVPSGGVIENDNKLWFASLEFAVAEETLPKVTTEDLKAIANDTWLTCGVIVFDSWIANEDRGRGNLLYDRDSGSMYLIDHGKAMFCGPSAEKAASELEVLRDKLVVHHNNHCLARHVTTFRDFPEWHRRIKEIPEYFIRESVEESVEVGLPADRESYCVDYLLERRERLKALFSQGYKTAFPKLNKQTTLFIADSPIPFDFEHGDFDYCI